MRRRTSLVIGISILTLTLVFSAFLFARTNTDSYTPVATPTPKTSPTPQTSPTPENTLTPAPTVKTTPTAKITPTVTPDSQVGLLKYALSLINSDRQAAGLQNVSLSSIDSGQIHANNLLRNGYLSHWDIQGFKPYMRYTLAGGQGAVSENCAWQGVIGNIFPIDVKSFLKDMEYSMMYDDASSNWGHRDNILTATHNKVSIGVAYDNHNAYLVQDFEDDYVTWNTLSFNISQVTMEGIIQKQGLNIQSVSIFYDNPTILTVAQLENSPYNDGYDPGTYVGLALPPNWQATGAITITADTWNLSADSFQISFSLSQAVSAYGKGVYTLYLETGSSTEDSLTTHSIWIT